MAVLKFSQIASGTTPATTDTFVGVQGGTTDAQYTGLQVQTLVLGKYTLTQPVTAATLTIANNKTLTVSNTLTFAGTDASTLNIGAGGTLGSNAFTSTAYAPLASPTFTGTVTLPNNVPIGGGTAITSSGPGGALTVTAYSATGQLPGIATNTVASAGNIGELVSSNVLVGSLVSLTSGVTANITSISLTAGHWEVSGSVGIEGGSVTNVALVFGAVTSSSATLPSTANGGAYVGYRPPSAGTIISSGQQATIFPVGTADIYLTTTTTYFLVISANFTVSTLGGYGFLRARRVQ